MDSATQAPPLPDGGLVKGGPSDPGVVERTVGLSDPNVSAWLEAGSGSGLVAEESTKVLRGQIAKALTSAAYRLSFEEQPSFNKAWTHGATARVVTGRIVGEAALVVTTEGVEARRRIAKLVGVFGLALAAALGALLYVIAPGAVFVGVLGGVAVAGCGALPYILTFGEFDSDVVAVAYSGTFEGAAGTLDENARMAFRVSVTAGRIRSRNGAGKGHVWRNVTAKLPASKDLGFLPGQILDAIGAQ